MRPVHSKATLGANQNTVLVLLLDSITQCYTICRFVNCLVLDSFLRFLSLTLSNSLFTRIRILISSLGFLVPSQDERSCASTIKNPNTSRQGQSPLQVESLTGRKVWL